jgi:hypothetical protein
MANTDKSPEQYYNKIPELKSSNLYIRDAGFNVVIATTDAA